MDEPGNRSQRSNTPNPEKSDEEIVNELKHLLNCDLNKLAANSETTRRYENMQKPGNEIPPPRPQNVFMLYRRDFMASNEFKDRPSEKRRAGKISKEIADSWNNEKDEIKNLFHALARIARKKHKETYKNYKFIRKSKIQRKNKDTKNVKLSPSFQTEELLEQSQPIPQSSTNPTPSIMMQDSDPISSMSLANDDCNLLGAQYLLLESQLYILPNPNLNPNFDNTFQTYEGIKLANASQQTYYEYDSFPYNGFEQENTPQQLYNGFEPENILQKAFYTQHSYNELANILQVYEQTNAHQQPYDYGLELENTPQQPYYGFEPEYILQQAYNFELTRPHNDSELGNSPQQTNDSFEL
ncbi:hypothetical protein RclHR1_01370026 [Rhizophagus clarus]|uniref:High mobility group box domain-containing protein n=1 Tax=Rhizophagus clarus TaxID=94130 RepID=A0A2Z6QAS5_9GLOM|nr:hypothetical protein RclHR1_01370026 [Rhizophagus clarus]GES77309.1 high mobility group box domain-containing protein [Rhizophagus clarus]